MAASFSSLLDATTVSAVEDVLLCGDWNQALNDSRSILAARSMQLRQDASEWVVMTTEEERVLSVYLQAVFELALDDEVETAILTAKAFSPLPGVVATKYCNFLIAMNRRVVAKQALQDLLASFLVDRRASFSIEQYVTAAETMALHILLPDAGTEAAQQFVTDDNVLSDADKLELLCRIQRTHLATHETNNGSLQILPLNRLVKDANRIIQATTDSRYQSVSTALTGMLQSDTKQDDDSRACYMIIGSAAIAVIAAVAGALRYREKIYDCMSNTALPAITSGIRDAKYVLFDRNV